MLLFWCSWFKYRFIKLDLVTVGKFCLHFSRVLGSVVDCVTVDPARAWHLNHALRDVQNVCALTKVGTVLKRLVYLAITHGQESEGSGVENVSPFRFS